ncbi:MAG: glycoside hydrolase family 97 N-terminal domain-containing protein, partial [Bacteroidaceae bacterium]
MKNFSAIILMFMSCSLGVTAQKAFQLQSPNKKTQVYIDVNKDVSFSVSQNQEILIEPSVIGMKIIGEKIVGKQPKVKKTTRTSVNRIVASPLYKKSEIKEKYNELKIDFKDKYSIVFRAYDKGIAYRFITTIKRDILVENEVALYRFPTDTKGYAAYANRGKSIEEQFTNSFENLYDNQSISKLNSDKLIILPFLVQLPNKKKICITETDLQDYPGQFLQTNGQDSSLKGIWASLPRVTKQGGHNELQQIVKERENFLAKTSGNRSFPWRIFVIASQDKDLLTSDLPYLMAEPTKSTDVSWVKPGKIAWDWWNDWNISGVDFRAGVNNQTYKYYIDFAAKNKIEYLILDEGWSVNLKADLMQVVPEINLEELVSYAKEKKVDIILWAGYWAFHRDMEKVIKHYSAMGIKGFKVDFMDR